MISLSAREAEGLKIDETTWKLHVTAGTVQIHLHIVCLKLEAGGKTSAVKKAQKLKLL